MSEVPTLDEDTLWDKVKRSFKKGTIYSPQTRPCKGERTGNGCDYVQSANCVIRH